MLSPLVTAASAPASSAPAFSRSSRSNPEPTMRGPSQPLRRRKARDDLSMTATEWPSALREMARPEPTRPHPTTITCTPQCNTLGRVVQKPGRKRGGSFLLLCGRGDPDPTSRPTVPLPAVAAEDIPETRSLPAQEQTARAAAGHRAAGHGAAEPAHRAGRVGAGLHLVVGLRHRGDADPAGALRRPGRLRPGRPHHVGHPGRPLLRHPLVPRGDSALHQGRRLLRGGPRQLRAQDRPDRRGGAPDRLHGDRRRPDVGRHRGAHQRRARAWPTRPTPSSSPSASCCSSSTATCAASARPGSYFAIPTYFFVFSLAAVIVVGFVKEALGQLHQIPLPPPGELYGGNDRARRARAGSMGLAFISLLRSFANGGSSLTGLEAISNGVSSFRRPESKHARQTLVAMSSTLGFLVLGVTLLARWTHAVPYAIGSPTVVSQEVKAVFGTSALGHVGFYMVAVGHHADPLHGWQHELQRLPLPGQLRGRRPLPAPPADAARPSPGLLQRDPGADRASQSPLSSSTRHR